MKFDAIQMTECKKQLTHDIVDDSIKAIEHYINSLSKHITYDVNKCMLDTNVKNFEKNMKLLVYAIDVCSIEIIRECAIIKGILYEN